MSENCEQGKEYGCPSRKECDSDRGEIDICTTNDPICIWTFAKSLKSNTRTWDYEKRLYACMSAKDIRATKTLYEQEIKGR